MCRTAQIKAHVIVFFLLDASAISWTMEERLKKTVLITGTSSGFGHATALHFAENGWNVIATMRNPASSDLNNRDQLFVTELDVTDKPSITRAINAGIERFGRIDLVVNNAGFGQYGVFEGVSDEKIRDNFEVNLFGVMNVTRAILPVFRQQKGGMIINVSSVGGLVGLPAASTYLSTKFALEGFTESVSYEMASQNIILKIVEPGGGDTAFHRRAAQLDVGAGGIESYEDFIKRTGEIMAALGKNMARPERIASVIFDAATDGTRRLRYLAGDDVRHFVDARRSLGDEQYEQYMRGKLT